MSFVAMLVVAAVSGFLAVTFWLQKRSYHHQHFQKQQAQFWSKVMANDRLEK